MSREQAPPFILAKCNGKMRDYYRIENQMGVGAYGQVMKCFYKHNILDFKNSIRQPRAVKIFSKNYMTDKDLRSFQNEVECLHILDHPNIMKMYHYFEDEKRYLLVTELIEGGDLFSRIKD